MMRKRLLKVGMEVGYSHWNTKRAEVIGVDKPYYVRLRIFDTQIVERDVSCRDIIGKWSDVGPAIMDRERQQRELEAQVREKQLQAGAMMKMITNHGISARTHQTGWGTEPHFSLLIGEQSFEKLAEVFGENFTALVAVEKLTS